MFRFAKKMRDKTTKNYQILRGQKKPILFLISRVVKYSGLWRLFRIRRSNYTLKLHPASISLALWIDRDARVSDVTVLRRLLKCGESFVDVGANIGHLSIEGAIAVGPTGCVTAYEAHPLIASYWRENVDYNRLGNLRLVNAAVGDYCGWVDFSDKKADDQNHISSSGGLKVPMVTLDTHFDNRKVTLLKIDVEGYELQVMMGAKNFLDQADYVYFEYCDRHCGNYGYKFNEIYDLMRRYGFQVGFLSGEEIRSVGREFSSTDNMNLLAWRNDDDLLMRTGWSIAR